MVSSMTNIPQRPEPTSGLRHVAFFCKNLESCLEFYTKIVGMKIEWQPDSDNYYLTSGNDNLALHRAAEGFKQGEHQFLDHIGFILETPDLVDEWYEFMKALGVMMKNAPRTHRDGARSFYCEDPDGRVVQMIFHPPISSIK